MALTVNWATKVIDSSASITDLPAFHAELRDLEDDTTGVMYPVTHSWKALDLGGAFFYGLELLNGYQLRFPTPGNYTIQGNLGGSVVPVAGVYVERKTSAAYTTTAIGGTGPSAADIAAAVLAGMGTSGTGNTPPAVVDNLAIAAAVRNELAAELARLDTAISSRMEANATVQANVLSIKGQTVLGDGTKTSPWRPAA